MTPPLSQRHQELAHALHELLSRAAPPGWRVRLEHPLPFTDDTQRVTDVVVCTPRGVQAERSRGRHGVLCPLVPSICTPVSVQGRSARSAREGLDLKPLVG